MPSQVILGIDPGIRHTGWCLLIDGKPADSGVIIPPGEGKMQVDEAISFILAGIQELIDGSGPQVSCASVEQVQWYGSRKSITLPLSHVAGAICGFLLGRGIDVYLLLAVQRRGVKIPAKWLKRLLTDHERDAYELAIVAKKHADALLVDASSVPRSLSAVARRRITVPKSVPSNA